MFGLGDNLLLELCRRLGRSRQLGLKGSRYDCIGGREGVQYNLSLRKSSERMVKN